MSTDAPAEVEARVRAWLRDEIGIPESELGRDAPLVSSGRLDSASLVRLATHLERTFGLRIPDRDIDVDHFDTLAMITDYVCGRV
jgi:acyl carrier protein